jgi:hypothetical protein
MDPAATIPGDRRNSDSIRDRILLPRLVTQFSVSTPSEFMLTISLAPSASFAAADRLISAGSSQFAPSYRCGVAVGRTHRNGVPIRRMVYQ